MLLASHPKRRDEILDLLVGSPRIAHTVTASVLADEFDVELRPKQVEDWRRKHHRKVAA